MESTTGKRLRQLRTAKGMDVPAFAAVLGVKPSAVYGLEKDANKPSFETIANLTLHFPDLNAMWLLHGTGEMFQEGRKLEPFLPGGVVGKQGQTVLPAGSLANQLGANFGEDIGGLQSRAGHLPKVPQNDQEFIQVLIDRINDYKAGVATLIADNDKLHRIISEQQHTVRFLQGQLTSLQEGKLLGNQVEAPGIYAFTTEPAPVADSAPIGFVLSYMRRKRKGPVHRRLLPEMEEQPLMELAA